MSIQNNSLGKIYDRFRSSDEQINFLMSEKGEMSLDREIIKMMKQMQVDEIMEFANQFFKYSQNQCSSLLTLINKELGKRNNQQEECDEECKDQKDELIFQQKNQEIRKYRIVSNLKNIPNIFTQMSKIKQALDEDLTNNSIKCSQGLNNNDQEDKIEFKNYTYQDYVPKISNDEDYLTENSLLSPIQFDQIPTFLQFQSNQNPQAISLKIQSTNTKIQQQKPQSIVQQLKELKNIQNSPQMQQNDNKLNHYSEQELQENDQEVPYSIPTTVEENQQLDFQEVQRIQLLDNKFKITYNNGDQYEGQLENQMKNGWGDYHYNTGQRYQGFFIDDQIHGYGQYFFLSGASYEGDWSSGMKHGVGILKFSNGDVYQGQFVKDQFHGKGTYNYANGDVFTGIWKNGHKNGKGKLETYDGSLQLGNWVDDKFQI